MPGLHLVCVELSAVSGDAFVTVTVYPQSRNESDSSSTAATASDAPPQPRKKSGRSPAPPPPPLVFEHRRGEGKAGSAYDDAAAYAALRRALEASEAIGAGLLAQRTANAWGFFTPTGEAIGALPRPKPGAPNEVVPIDAAAAGGGSLEALLAAPTSLLFEGGAFIWPGVRVGHRQRVPIRNAPAKKESGRRGTAGTGTGTTMVTLETLSMQPLVLAIDGFLGLEECDYIKEHAAPHVAQSGVSLMDKDRGKAATEWRTSATYFMPSKPHAPLQQIDQRVASLTRVPKHHQELVQVLRYEDGQKYDAHHDYFDPRLYSKDARTLRLIQHGKANRMATVLWYLSDVDGGGETVFPRAGNLPSPASNSPEGGVCERGLKVAPKKGKAIIFYSLRPDGKIDSLSLHGACPVVGANDKWAANKWVWSVPMSGVMTTP